MTPVELSRTVLRAVRRAVDDGELSVTVPERVVVTEPGPGGCGDFATNVALQLARSAGQSPLRVAEILRPRLAGADGIRDVVVSGPGFLNISLDAQADPVTGLVREIRARGAAYGHGDALAGQVVALRVPYEVRAEVVADAVVRIVGTQGGRATVEHGEPVNLRPVPAPEDPAPLGADAARWALLHPAPHDRPRITADHLVQRESNPLFRVRYAHARIRSLSRNAARLGFTAEPGPVGDGAPGLAGDGAPGLAGASHPGGAAAVDLGPVAAADPGGAGAGAGADAAGPGPMGDVGGHVIPDTRCLVTSSTQTPVTRDTGTQSLVTPHNTGTGGLVASGTQSPVTPDTGTQGLVTPHNTGTGGLVTSGTQSLVIPDTATQSIATPDTAPRAPAVPGSTGPRGPATPDTRRLLTSLADHPRILTAAATHRAPDRLARHLVTLADAVLPFLPSVLPCGEEKPSAAHRARLALAEAAGTVLAGGLSLLGIDAPEHL
ncbi:ArgS-related anticodon-binding protein NrtL [Streptomyces sp. NPDC007205]|uniref:ArgS-related anticodon-binding protein NrtL n=1 Tax=Streptomyces sp. NPDC007205 TaxID=3154316 RepID=UPI0033D3EE06